MERRTVLRGGITAAGAAWVAPTVVGRVTAVADGSPQQLFFDDFSQEPDNGATFDNFYGPFKNWDVTSGNVDLLGTTWQEGTVSLTGTQRVDLDGQSFSGTVTMALNASKTLHLSSGSYRLRARIEGNNRSDNSDNVVLRVEGITPAASALFVVPGRADYQNYDLPFTVGAGGAAVTVAIDHTNAGDAVGPILDSVEVTQLV